MYKKHPKTLFILQNLCYGIYKNFTFYTYKNKIKLTCDIFRGATILLT